MAMKRNSRFRRFIRSIFRFPLPDNEEEAGKFTARNFLLKFHSSHIREEHLALKHTFCLGGISALLFFTACISGIVLMLYYHPDIASAHNSILDIENVVPWGSFWRAVHRYSSELMIISVVLHMLRVVMHRAYKAPHEFNWAVGVALLLLLLLCAFTGYLLPFDVLSYDAVSVAKGISDNAPFIGRFINKFLFGGDNIGNETLLRFFVIHCIITPVAMLFLMFLHFWRVRKDGFKGGL